MQNKVQIFELVSNTHQLKMISNTDRRHCGLNLDETATNCSQLNLLFLLFFVGKHGNPLGLHLSVEKRTNNDNTSNPLGLHLYYKIFNHKK